MEQKTCQKATARSEAQCESRTAPGPGMGTGKVSPGQREGNKAAARVNHLPGLTQMSSN